MSFYNSHTHSYRMRLPTPTLPNFMFIKICLCYIYYFNIHTIEYLSLSIIYIFGEIRNNNISNNYVQLGSIVKRVNKHWYNSREVVGEENYQSLSNVHECPSSLSLLFPSFPIPSLPVPSLLRVTRATLFHHNIFNGNGARFCASI